MILWCFCVSRVYGFEIAAVVLLKINYRSLRYRRITRGHHLLHARSFPLPSFFFYIFFSPSLYAHAPAVVYIYRGIYICHDYIVPRSTGDFDSCTAMECAILRFAGAKSSAADFFFLSFTLLFLIYHF